MHLSKHSLVLNSLNNTDWEGLVTLTPPFQGSLTPEMPLPGVNYAAGTQPPAWPSHTGTALGFLCSLS